jgi:hypothetical protein
MHFCEDGAGFNEDKPGWYAPREAVWMVPTLWHDMPKPPKS